jgi:hypothetical protein
MVPAVGSGVSVSELVPNREVPSFVIVSHLRNATCIVVDLLCLWPAQMLLLTPGLAKRASVPAQEKTFPAHAAVFLELAVLLTSKYQRVSTSSYGHLLDPPAPAPNPHLGDHCSGDHSNITTGWSTSRIAPPSEASSRNLVNPELQPSPQTHPQEIDPLLPVRLSPRMGTGGGAGRWLGIACGRPEFARRHSRPRARPAGQFSPFGQPRRRCRLHYKTKASHRDGDGHECAL